MRGVLRLFVGASAVLLALGVPATVEAFPAVPEAAVELPVSIVAAPDPDNASAQSGAEDNPLRPVIGLGVIGIVFIFGLKAVKRQRDEGRRSKLPPIG